jgi:NAD(P)-dependent dehydrogenase (short-subunit alcohol dehydrogenase family)
MKTVCVMGGESGLGKFLIKNINKKQFKIISVTRKDCDLTDTQSIRNFFKNIKSIDGYVHCSANREKMDCLQDVSFFKKSIDINLIGAIVSIQEAISKLNNKGKVMVLGSSDGAFGNFANASYTVSKAALHSYIRCLGNQLKQQHEICCIAPGTVRDNKWEHVSKFIECFLENKISGLHGQIVRLDEGHHTFPI